MRHRMHDLVILSRTEKVLDERKRVSRVDHPSRELRACIRSVQSKYERKEPVEWEFLAELAFRLGEDVKIGDYLSLPGYEDDFFVVASLPARHYLRVQAIMRQRGAS